MKKIMFVSFSVLFVTILIGGIIYFSSTTANAEDTVSVEMLNKAVSELQTKIDESNAAIKELQGTVSKLQTTNESLNNEITSLKNSDSLLETRLTPIETEQRKLSCLRGKKLPMNDFTMQFYLGYSTGICN